MKKIILTSLAAILLATSANAGAYVSGYLKTMTDSESVSTGSTSPSKVGFLDNLNLDLTVGYAFDNGVRIEADVFSATLYEDNSADFIDNLDAQIRIGAVKGLYDFKKIGGKFTPYVGAGVTHNAVVNGIQYAKDGSLNFGIVGVAGVQFALSSKIALDLQYNRDFLYLSNANGKASYNGINTFKLGAVYKF